MKVMINILKKGFGFNTRIYLLLFAIFTVLIVAISLKLKFLWKKEFLEGITVEAFGMLFDILILGFIFSIFYNLAERKINIERYLEEIDDLRGWDEKEAMYRNMGNIKRLARLGIEYKKLDFHDCYLAGANLNGADLMGANFKGAILTRAKLRDTKFNNANLDNAILDNAELYNANLKKVNLESTSLNSANLSEANLEGAKLINAKLIKANLLGANLENAKLIKANLKGANLENAKLKGTSLNFANLSEANLLGANLENRELIGINFEGAILRKANLKGAYFRTDPGLEYDFDPGMAAEIQVRGGELPSFNFDPSPAILKKADLRRAHLSDAQLDHVDFSKANLKEAYLDRACLVDANFSDSRLLSANLNDADLEGTIFNGANLYNVKMNGAKNITVGQLQNASNLNGIEGLDKELEKELRKIRPNLFETHESEIDPDELPF